MRHTHGVNKRSARRAGQHAHYPIVAFPKLPNTIKQLCRSFSTRPRDRATFHLISAKLTCKSFSHPAKTPTRNRANQSPSLSPVPLQANHSHVSTQLSVVSQSANLASIHPQFLKVRIRQRPALINERIPAQANNHSAARQRALVCTPSWILAHRKSKKPLSKSSDVRVPRSHAKSSQKAYNTPKHKLPNHNITEPSHSIQTRKREPNSWRRAHETQVSRQGQNVKTNH